MKPLVTKILLCATLVACALPARAAQQWCTGTVSNVWVNAAGTVFAKSSWRDDYTQICNVTIEMGGVSVTTCLTWFAILRNATQRQSQVTVNYLDAPACNALPTYGNSPIPSKQEELAAGFKPRPSPSIRWKPGTR